MAVFYKGKKTGWFIPGMNGNINLDPAKFHPDMLPARFINMSADETLMRIPELENRIHVRKDGYVELILEYHYDKEAGQSRNKKVIIGSEASQILPGMMKANDNYNNLFDGRGRLYNDPMKKEPEPAAEQPQLPEQAKQQNSPPKQTEKPKAAETKQQPKKPGPEGKPTSNISNEDLQQKMRELKLREIQQNQRERELDAWQQELDEKEKDLYFQAADADKDHIRLLSYILDSYKDTINIQAKKKPDAPMTKKQIQTINQILSELKTFFTGCETEHLLHLAEEPDPANDKPGTTNGEMALLLSAYQYTIHAYKYDELRTK